MNRFFTIALLFLSMVLVGCGSKQPALPEGRQVNTPVVQETVSPFSNAEANAQAATSTPSETTAIAGSDNQQSFSLDDYDNEAGNLVVSDPFEPWNRFWFDFNDVLLLDVLKPVHIGYTKVMPVKVRSGLSNFSHNLASPVRFFNSLLQGRFTQAGVEFGRFFINTVTSLGFADVASQNKPFYPYNPKTLNFGHTLSVWGLPEGPYLVWPFFGPSTARGSVGMVGDVLMGPQNYILDRPVTVGTTAGLTFNELDKIYGPYEQLKRISFEPYIALRNGYLTLLRNSTQ